MAKHDIMVEQKRQQSDVKLAKIGEIIKDIKKSGARFDTFTKLANEVARRLPTSSEKETSTTLLIRKGSPYRGAIEKAWNEINGTKVQVNYLEQSVAEFKVEIRSKDFQIKELQSEIKGLNRRIGILLQRNSGLESNNKDLKTDGMFDEIGFGKVHFEYIYELLSLFCQPKGPFIFDKDSGRITNPLSGEVVSTKMPEGFLVWLSKSNI